ncbi:MAG: restriction endonuclease subunit S [Acidithiobacillus sp.]
MIEDWQQTRIEDIAERIAMGPFGSDIKVDNFVPQGVPIIRGGNLSSGRFNDDNFVYLTEEKADKLSAANAFQDDIVFTHRGTLGQVGIIPKTKFARYIVSQSQMKLTCKTNLAAPPFIYYFFKSNIGQQALLINTSQTGVPAISRPVTSLKNITILLPPLPEQRRIAHILGTLDDKIENNRKTAKTLEAMAQAIFKSWFVDFDPVRAKMAGESPESICKRLKLTPEILDLFPDRMVDSELGEIPEGWSVKQLADFCTTQYGYTTSATDDTAGPKLLRVTDINKNPWIDWRTVPHCSADQRSTPPYKLNEGDIVVARMADPGKSAIIEDNTNAIFASYLVRLKPKQENLCYFIYGFLKSELYAAFIEATKGGSVQFNMNAKVIVSASMSVPNNAILFFYQDTVARIRKNLALNISQVGALTEVRDTLLPKLISGEIRIPDAEHLIEEGAG